MKERLKKLREHLDLSQQSMADQLEILVTTLSKYERGVVIPTSTFLTKLHSLFSVNLNWLITGNGTMFLDTDNIAKECYMGFIKENLGVDSEDMEKIIKEIIASPVLLETISDFIKVRKGDKKALENLKHTITGMEFMFK